MRLNHPKTISPLPNPWFVEKLSSIKLVPPWCPKCCGLLIYNISPALKSLCKLANQC